MLVYTFMSMPVLVVVVMLNCAVVAGVYICVCCCVGCYDGVDIV